MSGFVHSTASSSVDQAVEQGTEQSSVGNLLLRYMAAADYALLRPHLIRVDLNTGDRLAEAGEPIDAICFLEGGIAAFLDVLRDGKRLAVGLLGREGFAGWPLLIGNDRWPHEVTVRARPCTALRIVAPRLIEAIEQSSRLRDLLLRYTSAFVAQMARTIVSNLIHPIDCRTARWILLYHDRVGQDAIALTHEELGIMLGVRRASVTEALHQLEATGAIKGLRGMVVVRDRAILEALAGETYGHAEAEYERLVGPHSALSPNA